MSRKYKCKHCGEYKEESIKLPVGRFCCFDHATEWAREKSERDFMRKLNKETKEAEKAVRAKQRERKERLRPTKWYADRAQREFNRFIRIRDAGKPCISCGKPDDGSHQRHASHYRSMGACSSLRFDEANCHASCSVCNNYLSGNIAGYTPALIEKIGTSEFERIKSAQRAKKWTRGELIDIYETYKNKCAKCDTINSVT